MKSLFPDICSNHIQESKAFYTELFGFKELVDLGWYVQLCSPRDENLQIAFVERNHESVPKGYQLAPRGVVVTIEVENADKQCEQAFAMNLPIVKPLTSEIWGQRHFMTHDPNGLLLDVYHMIEPDPAFLEQYGIQ